MKKVIVMLMALLLMATSAMAGTAPVALKELADGVSLVYLQPDGVAEVTIEESEGMTVVNYKMVEEGMPNYRLAISHSDVLNGMDLGDLDEDQIAILVGYTGMDSHEYSYTMMEMADGWPAVLIDYEGESDWTDAFTLISGYLVQVHGYHDDFMPMTYEENEYAFTLLDSVNIVETEGGGDDMVGMPNPMTESTAEEFAEVAGKTVTLPEGAQDTMFFLYTIGNEKMAELQFTQDGVSYILRAQPADEQQDIAGLYMDFAGKEAVQMDGMDGTVEFNEGAEGAFQWFDTGAKISYSLTMDKDANAAALTDMAAALFAK